jgi:DNA-binding NtrC family response regulator
VEKSVGLAFKKRDEAAETEKAVEYAKKNHGILGRSSQLRMLLHTVSQVAPLDISVLITGESGTGKELIARALHDESGKAPETFVAFNCGAIPDGLVESILFGHQKGAFTGAERDHAGYVEKAKGGTLFLDEVGELSIKAQATLLRFLQEREYVRVGGDRKMISDARVIASTNRDLEQDMDRKVMRADLYFRLKVVHIKVPPLRERDDDILILTDHFVRRFCAANALPVRTFSAGAARLLKSYDWPGNVRELMNMIDGILATTRGKKGVLTEKDLTAYSERLSRVADKGGSPAPGELAAMTYREAQEAFESSYFKNLLASHGGNVWPAAQSASIHPVTLRRKMAQLGLKQAK